MSRQTVYAHFPSRESLVGAALRRSTADALAALDAVGLDDGSAEDALLRLLDVLRERFAGAPLLLATARMTPEESHDLHRPVFERLDGLVRRGRSPGISTRRRRARGCSPC